MFSIILPSYLGDYPKAAKNRDIKLRRAIESVIEQSFTDWELIVIADGCDLTVQIADSFQDSRIKIIKVNKQAGIVATGKLRNIGISTAKGEWITYLDSDDVIGVNHLQILSQYLNSNWLFYNDYSFDKHAKRFEERECRIRLGGCGTSNITHLKNLNVKWQDHSPYGYDDWNFIKSLMQFPHIKIETPEYYVCHSLSFEV
jgi:glycosyltransferase involved in cell wall biosynthesis